MSRLSLTKTTLWVMGLVLCLGAFVLSRRPPIDDTPPVGPQTRTVPSNGTGPNPSPTFAENTLLAPSTGEETAKTSLPGQGETIPSHDLETGEALPWRIQAGLQSHTRIIPTRAMVGIGVIDDRDLLDDLDRENEGPDTNLVHFDRWLEAPVVRRTFGGWQLGPVTVPEAPAYRILAWGTFGYYMEDVSPSQFQPGEVWEVGDLTPIPFTGLKVKILHPIPEQFSLLLGRLPDPGWSEEDSRLAQILTLIAPEMKKTYAGNTMAIPSGEPILAPLIPDPAIRLCLVTRAGTKSSWVEVPLVREQINDIALDPEALFGFATHELIDLHGKLVYADGEPVQNAVIRMKGQRNQFFQADAHGRFYIPGLMSGAPSTFRVDIAPDTGPRPKSASRHHFTFTPSEVEDPTLPLEWTVPTYRWLVLGISAHDRLNLKGDPPYPIYLLQIEENGEWQDIAADAFIEEPDGLAISLTQNGTYRGVVALSPYLFLYTSETMVTAMDHEVFIPVEGWSQNAAGQYHLKLIRDDVPLAGVPVSVLGDHTSLPPIQAKTDATGTLQLHGANSRKLFVTIGEEEFEIPLAEAVDFEILIQTGTDR